MRNIIHISIHFDMTDVMKAGFHALLTHLRSAMLEAKQGSQQPEPTDATAPRMERPTALIDEIRWMAG
jgi:hypothetical protein